MRRRLLLSILVVLAACGPAVGDGIFVPDLATWKQLREEGRIAEPEQHAIIFFDNGQEQLFIKPKYEGPAEKFAWIVPVPSKPEVEIADEALFFEVFGATNKMIAAEPAKVEVLEQKVVGDYAVSVLRSEDGDALTKWLAENGYHLPDSASVPVAGYVAKGWTFVACKIVAAKASGSVRSGALQPLKLTFATKKPVYPLRLSAANPGPFDLIVHLIIPRPSTPGRYYRVDFERPLPITVTMYVDYTTLRNGEDDWWRSDFPLLTQMSRGREMDIYSIAWAGPFKADPRRCTSDLVWPVTERPYTGGDQPCHHWMRAYFGYYPGM